MRGLLIIFMAALLALLLRFPRDTLAQESDPATVTQQFDDALNAGQVDTALSLFADDAVVITVDNISFSGKAEIQTYLMIAVGANYHADLVGERQVSGDKVTWTADTVFGDNRVRIMNVAVVQGGKIKSITSTLVSHLTTASASATLSPTAQAAPTNIPVTGRDTFLDYPLFLVLGGLAISLGLGLRRKARRL
jgi:hypothetical protein